VWHRIFLYICTTVSMELSTSIIPLNKWYYIILNHVQCKWIFTMVTRSTILSGVKIQGDSKRWTQLKSKWRHNTRQTVGCGIRCTGWLAWATLKTLFNSSHVLLWYTWSVGAFAFTHTAYLLKLVIPATNALPRWRLNVEMKTKPTLHSSRRLSFNELTNAKSRVLHSSHFALNWRCCTAVR